MIVWVFFEGGAGGDSVANLLEHASNAVSIDGELMWRIHRYVDRKVKFWAPNLPDAADRSNTVSKLTARHIDIANRDDQYLIVTSHDLQFKNVFLNGILPDKKHIKLLVTRNSLLEQEIDFNIKNLVEFDQQSIKAPAPCRYNNMNAILNVDKISNWEYTRSIVEKIGLVLTHQDFTHYRKIVTGEIVYHTPGIEHYKSYIDNTGLTKYTKID